jgi:hypothetical protein
MSFPPEQYPLWDVPEYWEHLLVLMHVPRTPETLQDSWMEYAINARRMIDLFIWFILLINGLYRGE